MASMCKHSSERNMVVGKLRIDGNAGSGCQEGCFILAEQNVGLGHPVLPYGCETVAGTEEECSLQQGQGAFGLTLINV